LKGDDRFRQANQHLKNILYNRKTKAGYNESIEVALEEYPKGFIIKRASGVKGKIIEFNPRQYIIKN
jgi:hypothetical protein